MDIMRPETRPRWRACHILILVVLTGVVTAAAHGCERPPPQAPRVAVPSRPDQCWSEHAAELLLGDLALSVMRAYGRIDPQLIAVNSDTGQLQVSAESVVNPEFADQFQQALAAVNNDETGYYESLRAVLSRKQPVECLTNNCVFISFWKGL